MFYRLEDLICNPKLKDAEILYGDQFMKLRIHNIALMSEDDIDLKFIENTLLVVTGETHREDAERFIQILGNHKLGGVLLLDRTGKVHTKTLMSDFFKQYAEFCVYVQTDALMGEIVLDIMQEILARKNKNLQRISAISETFRSLDEHNYDSKQAVYVLSELLERSVSLTNFKKECVVSTSQFDFDASYTHRRKLINDEGMHEIYYREIMDYGNVMHVRLVCEIYQGQRYIGSLYIDEAETFVREQDYATIELTVQHIKKRTLFNNQLQHVRRYQQDDIVLALFEGRYSQTSYLNQACEQVGLDCNAKYRVVLWDIYDEARHTVLSLPDMIEYLSVVDNITEELYKVWPDFSYRINGSQLQFLVEDNFENDLEFKRFIHDTITPIVACYDDFNVTTQIGISDASDIDSIHLKYNQISDVMSKLVKTKDEAFIIVYHEYWFKSLLSSLVASQTVLQYLPESIRIVYEMGTKYRILVHHYIACRLDVTETALALEKSEKQVMKMIQKIQHASGLNMDDIAEVFELQAGMMMYNQIVGKTCKEYLV